MKKLILFCVAALLMASTSLFAQGGMYLAPKGQLAYVFGKTHDDSEFDNWTMNPGIGAGIIFGFNINQQIEIELNGSYEYWFAADDTPIDYTFKMIPLMAGINYSLNDSTGIIAGIGMTLWEVEAEYAGYSFSEDDSDLSAYVGAEFRINESVLIRPQLFYVDLEEDPSYQVKVEAAYKINL